MSNHKLVFFGNRGTTSITPEAFLASAKNRVDDASRLVCDILCAAPRQRRETGDANEQFAKLSDSAKTKHVCRANELLREASLQRSSAVFSRLVPEWVRQELNTPRQDLQLPANETSMHLIVEEVLRKLNVKLAALKGTLHEQRMERRV